MPRKAKAGVYRLTCLTNGHYYFGSSVDLHARKRSHYNKLQRKKHRNRRLQRCYDKYGKASIQFDTVILCDASHVLEYEQALLYLYHSDPNCLNFSLHATAPMKGVKFTPEHRANIAKAQQKYTYTFTFQDGHVETYNSLRECQQAFDTSKPSNVSRWFSRPNLGRKHGTLPKAGVIRAEKMGPDCHIILLPWDYADVNWKRAGATSRTQYYRNKLTSQSKSSSK